MTSEHWYRTGGFPRRLRKIIGTRSGREFARAAGISETVLRAYLAGRSEPTRPVLIALARAGGVDVGWLATGHSARR